LVGFVVSAAGELTAATTPTANITAQARHVVRRFTVVTYFPPIEIVTPVRRLMGSAGNPKVGS
jgi:hypothetical protein